MFGLLTDPAHLLIVVGIVLMLFGANRLPDLLREIGRSVIEFERNREVGPSDRTVRNLEAALLVLVALFLILLVAAAFRPEIFGY